METVWVDIYLYDSLSSGAGYSSGVSHRLEEILNEVKKLLTSCGCAKACSSSTKLGPGNLMVHCTIFRTSVGGLQGVIEDV